MKPIFSGNNDFNKTAFMNWRISSNREILNLLQMADGFLESSINLARLKLADNSDKKADILIFPILTNANHGIELYLKATIWIVNKINNSVSKIEGKHDIKQLFSTLRSKIAKYDGNFEVKDFDSELLGLKIYLEELYFITKASSKDNKMDFSRYPFGNKYDNHFYVEEKKNIEIDLENFIERFNSIKDSLDKISSYLYDVELNEEFLYD